MAKGPSWKVDVKSLSNQKLVELALSLDGSEHKEVVESLRRELVERIRAIGISNEEMVKRIASGVPHGRKFEEFGQPPGGLDNGPYIFGSLFCPYGQCF